MNITERLQARMEETVDGLPTFLPPASPPAPATGSNTVPLLGTKIALRANIVSLSKKTIGGYAEVQRICDLPIDHGLTEAETEAFGKQFINADQWEKGWRFFDIQAEAVLDYMRFGGGFFPIGVGWGKCQHANTEVFDPHTGRRRVDELGPLTTATMKEGPGTMSFAKATSFESGQKDCVRVILMSGEKLESSTDHPVYTSEGWVHAARLRPRDLVATPRKLDNPDPLLGVSDDEVALCAFLSSDGSTTNGSVLFTEPPGARLEEFKRVVVSCGGTAVDRKSKSCGKAETWGCRGLLPLTRAWGIQGRLSKEKRIPASWYRLPDRQVAIYLNRFLSCDGHIRNDPDVVEITLASEGLVRDLKFLLTRLGIEGRSTYKQASYVKDGGRRKFDAWRLTVSGSNLPRLLDIVGPLLEREEICAKVDRSLKINTNTDVVPISRKEIREICDELGYPGVGGDHSRRQGSPRTELRKRLSITSGQYVSRARFQGWVEESGYSGKYAWLATNDLRWQRVRSVEPMGTHKVYDLSVPETHNFVANGVVIHNTLISLMVAELAYRKGLQKSLLLVPPDVCQQLLKTDIAWARKRVHLTVPFMSLYNKTMVQRRQIANSGKIGCYILPYSMLSTKDTLTVEDRPGLLDMIDADLIIADEAHKLKNRSATRTKRMVNWIHNRQKQPEVVAMSGTITSKSIMDYHHLAHPALRDNCPLPKPVMLAREWASVIDAESQFEPDEASTGPIKPLVDWALNSFSGVEIPFSKLGFRRAYKLRLATAPGVAATGDTEIGTSLVMTTRPVDGHERRDGWDKVSHLMQRVSDEWVTPNGDEIEHAIHTHKWLFELTAGFYNELVWPEVTAYAARVGIGESEAADLIRAAKAHHEANQAFVRVLRKFLLDTSLPGLDTPLLVTGNMAQHGRKNVPLEVFDAWSTAKELEVDDMPVRDSRVVRLCDYKVQTALDWASKIEAGKIIWYYHNGIGDWLAEKAKEQGLHPVHCRAGAAGSSKILDHKNGDRLIIASMTAHGTGKNLQHFQHCYFTQWPRPAVLAEQVLGRLHRNGQEADELLPMMNATTEFDALNFAACLNDALYIHQTTGNRQKLVYAGYDPLPTIFPSDVLRERGFQNRQLTKEQQGFLDEKFA